MTMVIKQADLFESKGYPTINTISNLLEPAADTTCLTVQPGEADLVLRNLDSLPGNNGYWSTVHLVLDDKARIYAYDRESKRGTPIELPCSPITGKPLSIQANRRFLKNALQLGCLRIVVDPTGDKPVICTGAERTFVFMPCTVSAPKPKHANIVFASVTSRSIEGN